MFHFFVKKKAQSESPATKRESSPAGSTAGPRRRRLAFWELCAVCLGLVPAFLIGAVAGRQSHWTHWLEQIGTPEAWGRSVSRPPPAAVWVGRGEADFGEFIVRNFDPLSNLIRETSFRFRVVTAFDDRHEFDRFIRAFGYIIRDEVLVTIRVSTMRELQQPDFLARKIVTRVNRLLGQDALKSARLENLMLTERTLQTRQRSSPEN